MKTIILITMMLAIILLPFRRHFENTEKIKVLNKRYLLLIRFIYLGLAILWLFLNENNIILSKYDALRIGIPILWYTILPAIFLLLYAIVPLTQIWILPAVTLVLGWGMHTQKSLSHVLSDFNAKTDMLGFILLSFYNVFFLVLCIVILYLFGPYLKKIMQRNNNVIESK